MASFLEKGSVDVWRVDLARGGSLFSVVAIYPGAVDLCEIEQD